MKLRLQPVFCVSVVVGDIDSEATVFTQNDECSAVLRTLGGREKGRKKEGRGVREVGRGRREERERRREVRGRTGGKEKKMEQGRMYRRKNRERKTKERGGRREGKLVNSWNTHKHIVLLVLLLLGPVS